MTGLFSFVVIDLNAKATQFLYLSFNVKDFQKNIYLFGSVGSSLHHVGLFSTWD